MFNVHDEQRFLWPAALTSTSKLSSLKILVGGSSSAMNRKISKFPRYHFTAHTFNGHDCYRFSQNQEEEKLSPYQWVPYPRSSWMMWSLREALCLELILSSCSGSQDLLNVNININILNINININIDINMLIINAWNWYPQVDQALRTSTPFHSFWGSF